MRISSLTRLLIGVILVVALPGIGCFGWYSLDTVANTSTFVKVMVVAAYPAALISLAFLLLELSSSNRNQRSVWISGLSLAVALAIIFIARNTLLPS